MLPAFAGLQQRQADRRAFRDILQPDAESQRQCPAERIGFAPEGKCGCEANRHPFRQIVEGDGQHHPAAFFCPARAGGQKLAGHLFQPEQADRTEDQPP